MKTKVGILVMAATLMVAGSYAETFGTGGNQFSIDFVDIGNAGNVGEAQYYSSSEDVRTFGAVDYNYRMGKYEVTIDQFAKARAADSRIGDGDEGYGNDGTRTVGTGGSALYVSAYEAMKFANFLTTGDAYTGAYQYNGSGVLTAVDRDAAVTAYGTVYVLPTEDEWYKAAYYKPVNDGSYSLYANGSDDVGDLTWGTANGWNYRNGSGQYVIGSPNYMWETGFGAEEQNGTYDMMGNVWEWNESAFDGTLDDMAEARVYRGGVFSADEYALRSSNRVDDGPASEDMNVGFRVTAIPEPSSIAMIGLVSGCAVFIRRRFLI